MNYIVMGVSGCGKTTIAKGISQKLNIPFYDADDFHSMENKEKMSKGIPLNDDDRAGWLQALHDLLKTEESNKGAALACSALKEKYRAVLLQGLTRPVQWIVLHGDYDLIWNRMNARKDHYMPAALLRSQFETIEYPDYGLHFNIEDSPDSIIHKILEPEK